MRREELIKLAKQHNVRDICALRMQEIIDILTEKGVLDCVHSDEYSKMNTRKLRLLLINRGIKEGRYVPKSRLLELARSEEKMEPNTKKCRGGRRQATRVTDIESNEVTEYPSIYRCAKSLDVTPNKIIYHYQVNKLLKGRFKIDIQD